MNNIINEKHDNTINDISNTSVENGKDELILKKTKIPHLWKYIFLLIVLVSIDYISKIWAKTRLEFNEPIVIWNKVFELRYLENRGAAFGILQNKQVFFIIITIITIAMIIYLINKIPRIKRYNIIRIFLIFILAGAIGNLYDRIMHGYVIDFLYFVLIDFPIFNVADMYVSVSSILFALSLLTYYKNDKDLLQF